MGARACRATTALRCRCCDFACCGLVLHWCSAPPCFMAGCALTEDGDGAPLMGAAAPRSDGLPPMAPSAASLPLPPRPPSCRGSSLNLQQLCLPRPEDPKALRGSRSLQSPDPLQSAPPESAATLQSVSRRSSLGATLGGLVASVAPRGAVQGLLPGAYSLPIAQSLEQVRGARIQSPCRVSSMLGSTCLQSLHTAHRGCTIKAAALV